MYSSVYRSRALFQWLELGFCGVGGGVWREWSVLVARMRFGCWILVVVELGGGKFISPITFALTCSGSALERWKSSMSKDAIRLTVEMSIPWLCMPQNTAV